MERYAPMVRAIALASKVLANDTDDIVQEVMLAAVEALRRHRYDRQRGRFKALLKGVIYHKILDARAAQRLTSNRNSRFDLGPSVAMNNVADPHPSPAEEFEAAFETEWRKVAFEEALDEIRKEIDPATYQAFDLYVRKNMAPRDVAKLLGLSRNAVYIAKSRILERVKQRIAQEAL